MFHPKIEEPDVLNAGVGIHELTGDITDEESLAKNLEGMGISLEIVRSIVASLTLLRKSDFKVSSAEEAYAGGVLDGIVMGIRMTRAARERVLGAGE